MHELFPEWYGPTPDDVAVMYRDATIVLDANILLALYRTSVAEREEILNVLRRVQDRLWVPYQAALEYQRNRLGVVYGQARVYVSVRTALSELQAKIEKALETHRAHEPLARSMSETFEQSLSQIRERVDELESEHGLGLDDTLRHDPVREALDELLVGRVGNKPTDEELSKRMTEGQRRLKDRIPPGYEDVDKDNPERAVGDYLIWAEVLEMSKQSGRPTLLITEDRKEDWFATVGGRTVGPRPELVAEMRAVTKHRYHQQDLRRFLQLAGEHLDTPVGAATIDRVAPDAKPSPRSNEAAMEHFWRVIRPQLATYAEVMERQRLVNAATVANYEKLIGQTTQEPTAFENIRRLLEAWVASRPGQATEELDNSSVTKEETSDTPANDQD